MRNLFGLVILILVLVVGLGFYQGWFHFSTISTGQTSSATITVDQSKLHEDEQKAKDKMQGFRQDAKEKVGGDSGMAPEPERRN